MGRLSSHKQERTGKHGHSRRRNIHNNGAPRQKKVVTSLAEIQALSAGKKTKHPAKSMSIRATESKSSGLDLTDPKVAIQSTHKGAESKSKHTIKSHQFTSDEDHGSNKTMPASRPHAVSDSAIRESSIFCLEHKFSGDPAHHMMQNLKAGDLVRIVQRKPSGWWWAMRVECGADVPRSGGYVPASFLRPKSVNSKVSHENETPAKVKPSADHSPVSVSADHGPRSQRQQNQRQKEVSYNKNFIALNEKIQTSKQESSQDIIMRRRRRRRRRRKQREKRKQSRHLKGQDRQRAASEGAVARRQNAATNVLTGDISVGTYLDNPFSDKKYEKASFHAQTNEDFDSKSAQKWWREWLRERIDVNLSWSFQQKKMGDFDGFGADDHMDTNNGSSAESLSGVHEDARIENLESLHGKDKRTQASSTQKLRKDGSVRQQLAQRTQESALRGRTRRRRQGPRMKLTPAAVAAAATMHNNPKQGLSSWASKILWSSDSSSKLSGDNSLYESDGIDIVSSRGKSVPPPSERSVDTNYSSSTSYSSLSGRSSSTSYSSSMHSAAPSAYSSMSANPWQTVMSRRSRSRMRKEKKKVNGKEQRHRLHRSKSSHASLSTSSLSRRKLKHHMNRFEPLVWKQRLPQPNIQNRYKVVATSASKSRKGKRRERSLNGRQNSKGHSKSVAQKDTWCAPRRGKSTPPAPRSKLAQSQDAKVPHRSRLVSDEILPSQTYNTRTVGSSDSKQSYRDRISVEVLLSSQQVASGSERSRSIKHSEPTTTLDVFRKVYGRNVKGVSVAPMAPMTDATRKNLAQKRRGRSAPPVRNHGKFYVPPLATDFEISLKVARAMARDGEISLEDSLAATRMLLHKDSMILGALNIAQEEAVFSEDIEDSVDESGDGIMSSVRNISPKQRQREKMEKFMTESRDMLGRLRETFTKNLN